jgi:hypothetical protein
MCRALRRSVFLISLGLWPVVAQAADPLVFFLMSAAKEIASRAIESALAEQARVAALPVAPPPTYPGTAVEPETLRKVVNDSFVYLSLSQRAEIFDSLNAMLLDPKLGGNRAALIEYFLHKALAVRVAQIELGRLTYAQKEGLARQFRHETASLPDEERRQLQSLLEQHLLPVPADLNEMLLAQLQEPR